MANKLKRSLAKINNNKNMVFVIMPFGDWHDIYFDEIYKKAIKKTSLNPIRLDDPNGPDVLVQQMFSFTKKAEVILADLTGNNPNVCYELGLAHALDKPTILISESVEDIPFDITPFRVIKYDKNVPDWGEKLKTEIVNSLNEVVKSPDKFKPSKLLSIESSDNTNELESIRREMEFRSIHERLLSARSRLNPDMHKRIVPQEAIILLEKFLKIGKSESFIINRLSYLGAPKYWVQNRLNEKRKKQKIILHKN